MPKCKGVCHRKLSQAHSWPESFVCACVGATKSSLFQWKISGVHVMCGDTWCTTLCVVAACDCGRPTEMGATAACQRAWKVLEAACSLNWTRCAKQHSHWIKGRMCGEVLTNCAPSKHALACCLLLRLASLQVPMRHDVANGKDFSCLCTHNKPDDNWPYDRSTFNICHP